MHAVPIGSITAETLWPASVVQDLTLEPGQRGFQLEAAQQTGVSAANDFINEPCLTSIGKHCLERMVPSPIPSLLLARAQVGTIRWRLLKIGAQIRVTVRKIWVQMSSSFPLQTLFAQALQQLRS